MRNVSDKSCRENQNTQFVFSDLFFENRTVYEIMWKNIVHERAFMLRYTYTAWTYTEIQSSFPPAPQPNVSQIFKCRRPLPPKSDQLASSLTATFLTAVTIYQQTTHQICKQLYLRNRFIIWTCISRIWHVNTAWRWSQLKVDFERQNGCTYDSFVLRWWHEMAVCASCPGGLRQCADEGGGGQWTFKIVNKC